MMARVSSSTRAYVMSLSICSSPEYGLYWPDCRPVHDLAEARKFRRYCSK